MWPYLAVYLLLVIFATFDLIAYRKKNINLFGLLCSFLALLGLIGLRYETGTDWLPYKDNYENVANGGTPNDHFESGYSVLVSFFVAMGASYTTFMFFYTGLYLLLFFNFFFKTKNPNILVLLFYSSYIIGLMGAARQILAISICLNAYYFLVKQKNGKFFLWTLLAATIHYSALVFIVLFLLKNKINYSSEAIKKLILFIFLFYMMAPFMLGLFANIFSTSAQVVDQLLVYSVSEGNTNFVAKDNVAIGLMFIKRFILFFLVVYFFGKNLTVPINYIAFNAYSIGLVIFSSLYFLAPAIGVRLSLYFNVFDIVLLSYFVNKDKDKVSRVFVFFFILIFSSERIITSLNYDSDLLVPYKGLFINENLSRVLR